MAKQFLDITGVTHLWGKIKTKFATQAELTNLNEGVDSLGLEVQGQGSEITSLQNNKADKSELAGLDEQVKTNTHEIQNLYKNKQDKLVSGTNIKTVGGKSLLGTGDIPIPPQPDLAPYATKSELATAIPNTELDKILV